MDLGPFIKVRQQITLFLLFFIVLFFVFYSHASNGICEMQITKQISAEASEKVGGSNARNARQISWEMHTVHCY